MEQDIHLYTDKEIAFVLNHTDWCLREKADYTSTIQSALLEYANTRRDVASVLDVLKGIVTLSGKSRPSVSDLFRIGTNCLKLETLPLEFLHEMNIQRRKLGLEQFPLSCFQEMTSSSSETASQKVNTEMYMKRSSTQNRDGSRISYREGTVEESEESDSGKETKDADFIYNAPNARKVKVSTKRPEKLSTRTTTQANSLSHSSPYSQTFVRPSTTKAFPSYRTSTPVSTNKMGARRVIEMSDGSESQITYKNDRYHPNKRKKLHNDSPPVLAPVSSEKVREPTTILQQPQTSIVAQAQRRVQPRHVGLSAEDASTPRTTQPGTMEQRMTDMGDLIFMLINEQSRAGQTTTPEIKQRLKSMSRTMKRDPGNLRDTMIQDLTAADSQREKYQETLKSLIGHQDFEQNASFPIKPPHSELDTAWRSIRQGIKDAFGNEYPEESTPKGWAAGFIASRVEDLLKNSKKTFPPKKYIDEVKHYLDSPHTVQTLIGGFICSRVFTTPDPLCEGFYCPKEMKLYEAKMLSGGPSEVQLLDKISAKLMLNDDDDESQRNRFENRASTLLENCNIVLKAACPSAPGFHALNNRHKWMRGALKLKQALMISPTDYHIHFFLPGTPFDSASMQAEDDQAFPVSNVLAKGKVVLTCLFPALVELDLAPFGKDTKVADLLVVNKNFFPTWQERKAFDPKTVVSKAYVLLE